MPKRIQLQRTKDWRKPEGAVVVSRPTRWGNPFTGTDAAARFRKLLANKTSQCALVDQYGPLNGINLIIVRNQILRDIDELRGKDLCCWCSLDKPCHADVLLELANR